MNEQPMENRKGEIWQDLIRRIAPEQLTTLSLAPHAISPFLETAAQARNEFTHRLMEEMTGLQSEEQIKVRVYGYQTFICFFINQVFGYWEQMENQPEVVRLYETVLTNLEDNLLFLQHYFPRYFDQEAAVPKTLLRAFQNRVDGWETQITQLPEQIDPALVQRIFSVIHSLPDAHLNFGQLSYIDTLREGLIAAVTSSLEVPYGSPLIQWCIVQNFNAPPVLEWIVGRITETLQGLETDLEKKEWLTGYQKYLYQLPADPKGGLLVHRLSMREQLLGWIEQEMIAGQADQKKETEVVGAIAPAKINTSVSVPVLALLTRAFKEAGIITNSNLQEIFRLVSAHYTSQRKESISAGNFHGKYYNVEESTKRKVSDLLLELVKVVKRMP